MSALAFCHRRWQLVLAPWEREGAFNLIVPAPAPAPRP
jgi:hypothetical protein